MNWISVEDKMPEAGTHVLTMINDIVSQWQEVLKLCDKGTVLWIFLDGNEMPCIVTHWMPLPEPPIDLLEDK